MIYLPSLLLHTPNKFQHTWQRLQSRNLSQTIHKRRTKTNCNHFSTSYRVSQNRLMHKHWLSRRFYISEPQSWSDIMVTRNRFISSSELGETNSRTASLPRKKNPSFLGILADLHSLQLEPYSNSTGRKFEATSYPQPSNPIIFTRMARVAKAK